METESKYLKKIRDEIEKKSGKAKEHTGPNTVANYLNDIAKGVKDLDVGGGGGGIIEGPFSFTNETKRGTGNKTTDIVEISNEVIDYKSVTTNSNNIVINELKINPASADNSYPNVEIKAEIDNADIPDIVTDTMINEWGLVSTQKDPNGDIRNLTARFATLAISKYEKSTDKDTIMDVRPDDIVMTGSAGNTWDGTHDSLKEALAMIPKVHTVSTGNSISIRSHDEAGLQFPLDFVDDIEKIISWSIVTGNKNGGSSVVEYTAANIHGPVLVQPAVEGDPVMFNFDLVNDTDSLVTFDVVKAMIVTVG